jgi:hypothetical protein
VLHTVILVIAGVLLLLWCFGACLFSLLYRSNLSHLSYPTLSLSPFSAHSILILQILCALFSYQGSVGLVANLGTGFYDLFYEPVDGLLGASSGGGVESTASFLQGEVLLCGVMCCDVIL